MEKMKMHSMNKIDDNVRKLASLFPECITEIENDKGELEKVVDIDVFKRLFSKTTVEGGKERYQFTWPEKSKAVAIVNQEVTSTLRPSREESVNFDSTENLYIEGDNLEVLKLLQETYLGKIKMIYIDPPYNTGNDFVYDDDFSMETDMYINNSGQYDNQGNRLVQNPESNGRFHTDWLNMMYPRLKLSKDLLSDDGVIFISIDDNEVDNLRKICDEIFGESNFIAHIIHKNNSMKNQSKYIGVSTEYILIYCKDLISLNEKQPFWRVKKKGAADINKLYTKLKSEGYSLNQIREEIMEMYSRPKYAHLSRWNKVDEQGLFIDADLSRANGPKNYTIINPSTGKPCKIPNRGWGKSYEELLKLQKENLIWYGDDTTPPRAKSYLTEDSESVFDNFIFADTSGDKREIEKMFGSLVFEFPKSLEMMRQIISLCTGSSDIVLDFFSGSATTALAVMKLNEEDNNHRKFIMVQIPEVCDEKSEAYKAGYKNICEIGKERIRRAGKQIAEKQNHDDLFSNTTSVDIGFRDLKLDSSNMNDVYYTPEAIDQDTLTGLISNIKEDRTAEDLLFQVMLDLGVFLSAKIDLIEIQGKRVFSVENGYLIACFDEDIKEDIIIEIAQKKPTYFVMRDSSLSSDSVSVNFDQLFERYSPDTIRKII